MVNMALATVNGVCRSVWVIGREDCYRQHGQNCGKD